MKVDKIEHLKKFGIYDTNGALTKMYSGQKFDCNDPAYKALLEKSDELCRRYTELCGIINPNADQIDRKNKILDDLFPGHGVLYGVGAGIKAVIGMVNLGENCYINTNVHFHPDVLVTTGNHFICAPNVSFGKGNCAVKNVGYVNIENDVWLCADVKVAPDVYIGNGSVVALAGNIKQGSQLKPMSIYGGNPAKFLKAIEDNPHRSVDAGINFIENLPILKRFYFSNGIEIKDTEELVNLLSCKSYNSLDPYILRMSDFSHQTCAAYNLMNEEERALEIKTLFPISGKNCSVGANLQLDCIGTVILGDNVKIGNNVTMMGNIKIGNNCSIADNVSLIAIGHSILPQNRTVRSNPDGNYLENTSGYIVIKDNISIGFGSKIISNQVISKNIIANRLVLRTGRKIKL